MLLERLRQPSLRVSNLITLWDGCYHKPTLQVGEERPWETGSLVRFVHLLSGWIKGQTLLTLGSASLVTARPLHSSPQFTAHSFLHGLLTACKSNCFISAVRTWLVPFANMLEEVPFCPPKNSVNKPAKRRDLLTDLASLCLAGSRCSIKFCRRKDVCHSAHWNVTSCISCLSTSISGF